MQRKASLVLLLSAALLCYFLFFSDSSEQVLRKNLQELALLVSFGEQKEHPLESLKASREVLGFFVDAPELEFQLSSGKSFAVETKEELSSRLTALRRALSRFEVNLEVKRVSVSGAKAEVEVVATALGAMPGVEGSFFEAHLVQVYFTKASGEWLISGVTQIKNLREQELASEEREQESDTLERSTFLEREQYGS